MQIAGNTVRYISKTLEKLELRDPYETLKLIVEYELRLKP